MRWAGEAKRRKSLGVGRGFLDSTGLLGYPQGRWATDLGKPVFHAQIFNIIITATYLLLLYVYIFIMAFKNEDILNS